LIQFNDLLTNAYELISNPIITEFKCFLLPSKIKPSFMNLVESKSNSNRAVLSINRTKALALRNGQSDRFTDSMISQFSSQYRDIQKFRGKEIPFHVSFIGEPGVNCGG
jgi:hypothetical protein